MTELCNDSQNSAFSDASAFFLKQKYHKEWCTVAQPSTNKKETYARN